MLMLDRASSYLSQIVPIFFFAASLTGAGAANVDPNALKSLLSPTNYYSRISLEVSRNFFLSDERPEFTQEPDEMARIEGALLPNSFFINLGSNAYGGHLIKGESEDDYWTIGKSGAIAFASRNPQQGGTNNYIVSGSVLLQRDHLRAWLRLGMIHVSTVPLEIEGERFTGRSWSGEKLRGRFTAVTPDGFPTGFTYEFGDNPTIRAEGVIEYTDPVEHKFNCSVGLWRDERFWKRIRIQVDALTRATEADGQRYFKPSDFLAAGAVVPKLIVESNGIRNDLLPSGELRPFPGDVAAAERRHRSGFLSRWGWIAPVVAALAALLWLLARSKKTKQRKG